MCAVTGTIMHMIERTALGDTAAMTVGAIAADAVIPVEYERLNVPEPPYEFHASPIGLMGNYDRHGGSIVCRYRYGAPVEG